MVDLPRPVRIAHAYGNSRGLLRRALAADIDMIEADIWYRSRDIWVRHERRLAWLPLLIDRQMRGHRLLPLSLTLWRGYYLRPEIPALKLGDLLHTVAGKKRLLLDVKGRYRPRQALAFARTLAARITEHGAEAWTATCGQEYAVLNCLRRVAPHLEVRYSIERPDQWRVFKRLAERDSTVRAVCMHHRFLTAKRARLLEERGIDLYCWTVDDAAEARRLAQEGVDGIISNDLRLLAALDRRGES